MKYFKKNGEEELAPHLSAKEYSCRCTNPDCGLQLVAYRMLHAYQMTRVQYGSPITVTSGFRCQKHNDSPKVNGNKISMHKYGYGIDLTSLRLDILEESARAHFDIVIRYEKYIHCHMSLAEYPRRPVYFLAI